MSGRCKIRGAVVRGVQAVPVDVEVAVSSGLPAFNVVGMADAAVQESRERVRTALKAAGFSMPCERVIVNLAPSSLKKTGSGFDLPIAVGILVATGQIPEGVARDALFVGELSLDGRVRSVAGLLAYAICARSLGCDLVCCVDPVGLMPVEGLVTRGLSNLVDLRESGFCEVELKSVSPQREPADYREVSGNDIAKRACQIAAAGHHGLLMCGPPGSGKTMLASRLGTIMPPLDERQRLETALIHSVAGENVDGLLAGKRPFRAPHHSATGPGLIGGGTPIRPGEVSLAHLGVLFLDELAEFKMSVLQQVRQPLESGAVCLSRADGNIVFPARFLLVAATNPCPCGYFGDAGHKCTCTAKQVRDYHNRIGGPLMDRIDLHIDVRRVPPSDVIATNGGTSSEELRDGVLAGWEFASWRKARCGEADSSQKVVASCRLEEADRQFFEKMAKLNDMSGRAIIRTLSVARTIADIDRRERVSKSDLCEALGFRLRDTGEV